MQIAQADENSTAGALPFKATVGDYVYSTYRGVDFNARWRGDGSDGWLGVYSDSVFGTQGRLGADTTFQPSPYLQIQPSVQAATRGFLGASLNVQIGGAWYGLAGIGRTNGRPYFNLNFDPNDALTFGAGHQAANGSSYSLFVVADDRFNTGQRDWHINARVPVGDDRITVDVLRKNGWSDAGRVVGWGASVNYDWPRWFLRLAYDPYQNFSVQNAWRFAAGIRF